MTYQQTPALLLGAVILTAFACNAHAASIVGGWYGTDLGQAQSTLAAIFLGDGEYVEVEDGNSILDPSGQNGMERGTYTWNSLSGAISIDTILDTDGQWGFSNVHVTSVDVTDTTLSANTSDGTAVLTRVADPDSPIIGSWYFTNNPAPGDLTVLTFLPNGEFLIAIDPPAGGYMEFGTYSWDPLTNSLTSSIIDSTAPSGSAINLPSFTSADLQDGGLQLSSDTGSLSFSSAATPEPTTFSAMIAGLGFAALACLRKRPNRG